MSTYPAEAYDALNDCPDTMTTSDYDRLADELSQQTLPAPSDRSLSRYLDGLDVCRSALAAPRAMCL